MLVLSTSVLAVAQQNTLLLLMLVLTDDIFSVYCYTTSRDEVRVDIYHHRVDLGSGHLHGHHTA